MGGIADYNSAKAIDDYLNASPTREIHLTHLTNLVGVRLDLMNPSYSTNTWERFDADLGRTILVEIIDKLGPAILALFHRHLAEHIERRRKDAIEWAMKRRFDDERRWAKELLKLGVEYDPGEDEGALCCRNGCDGVIEVAPVENCSCHVKAPCGACENSGLRCPKCGWTSKEDE